MFVELQKSSTTVCGDFRYRGTHNGSLEHSRWRCGILGDSLSNGKHEVLIARMIRVQDASSTEDIIEVRFCYPIQVDWGVKCRWDDMGELLLLDRRWLLHGFCAILCVCGNQMVIEMQIAEFMNHHHPSAVNVSLYLLASSSFGAEQIFDFYSSDIFLLVMVSTLTL